MKGKLLTERELKALPDGARVHLYIYDPAAPAEWDKTAYVEQRGDCCMFQMGKGSMFYSEYEYTGNPDTPCQVEDPDLEVYQYLKRG